MVETRFKKFKILLALLALFSFPVLANAVTVLPLNWFPNDGAVVANPFVFEVRCFIQDETHGGLPYESTLCQCQARYAPIGAGQQVSISLPVRTDGSYRSALLTLAPNNYNVRYTCSYAYIVGQSPYASFTVASAPTPTPTPTPSINRYLIKSKTASPLRVLQGQNISVSINFTGAGDPTISERRPLDVVLTLDRSWSMSYYSTPGSLNNKVTDAKIAAKGFVGNLNVSLDQVGLVSFNESVTLDNPLTFNYAQVNASIDTLLAYGITNMGDAIYNASAELTTRGRSSALKVILLLTDGVPTAPYGNGYPTQADYDYALNAARAAATANYPIYVIGLGLPMDPQGQGDLNETFLRQIAVITGGKYYNATDSSTLAQIFLNISIELMTSAASRVGVIDVVSSDMIFQGPIPSTCNYEAVEKRLKCFRGLISINESWLISFNVSSYSHGQIPTNEQCNYSYIAADGTPQSSSLDSPLVYVIKPHARLAAQPSWDYGPFDSELNASFYDLPEGNYVACFDCGDGQYVQGQSGEVSFQVAAPPAGSYASFANAFFNCSYLLVEEVQYYNAKVIVFYGPGGQNNVSDEAWVSDYPRSSPSPSPSASPSPFPSPSPSVSPSPTPNPSPSVSPVPPFYPPGFNLLSAVCPTSLVLGPNAKVTGFLVVNGTPNCSMNPDNWQFTLTLLTEPQGAQSAPRLIDGPASCDSPGYNVFKIDGLVKGAYKADLIAYVNTTAGTGVGDDLQLSSSCRFSVLPQPPSQFPDVPLFVVALAALGVFVFLARFKKRKR